MIASPTQSLALAELEPFEPRTLLAREWLVTNGLGGYASGTISGACTRRYHGLLIAALPAPLGRTVMFNHLAEELRFPDRTGIRLDTEDLTSTDMPPPSELPLREFRLEHGLPVWRYEVGPLKLEKRVLLPYLQNSVYVTYRLLEAPSSVRLRLHPSVHFRMHEAPVGGLAPEMHHVAAKGSRIELHCEDFPPLRLHVIAPRASLVLNEGETRQVHYLTEEARGYEHIGHLWNPGYFRADLAAGEQATLVAGTEEWDTILAVGPEEALASELQRRKRLIAHACPKVQQGRLPALVLAADQFIIRPNTRVADAAVAHAAGDDVRTVIAGYHWFTDWGRDTMISLEGLLLTTGRHSEAGYLLRTFARYVRDGLIPNMFPEGEREGLYHTADATLWLFHALHRYLQATEDRDTLELLLPTLRDIVEHHVRGTRFGIHVDPEDGLLSQGAEGYQLTWMDAKVGDWVVTPRRGKAVEINALWYNALRLLERWSHESGDDAAAAALARQADQTQASFNRRFWHEEAGYLYDVIDGERGNDPALRPNQLLAISLDHPVLESGRWKAVVDQVTTHLLTPVGLRSLAPAHPDYKPSYDGDLRARDAAYHQGTVWAWLIGPFIDAWLRVHPYETETAREFLAGFEPHMAEAGIGSISEIFDAEPPFHPRGCIAQAWSVAEVLRVLAKLEKTEPASR
jgi:predicted glycogen debranching enzyme